MLATSASTVYEPLTWLAVRVGAWPRRCVPVSTVALVAAPGKVPLGPLVGATNSTLTPETGQPPVSITSACRGLEKPSPTLAVWADPPVTVTPAMVPVQAEPVAAEAGAAKTTAGARPPTPTSGHAGERRPSGVRRSARSGPPAIERPMIMSPAVRAHGATVHQAAPPPEPPDPPRPPPKPPKPPKAEQPEEVGWVTMRVVALTAPMLLVEPVAVAHSPTLSAPDVPLARTWCTWSTWRRSPSWARSWWWPCPFENVTVTASTSIFEPDFEVTLPEAEAKLAGRVKVTRTSARRPGGDSAPREAEAAAAAGSEAPERIRPWWRQTVAHVVASTLPPEPLVPVAEMHVPFTTSLSLTETVAVMTVLELRLTVVWPLWGFAPRGCRR